MPKSGLRFLCRMGNLPENTFAVADFTLREGLSDLFTLNLTLVQSLPDNPFKPKTEIDLTALLMQEAVLQVFLNETEQRKITGIISHANWCGTDGNKTLYTFTVRPFLWRLTLNQDSHIYHRQSVPDIIGLLLKKHHVQADSQLEDTHQNREYTTQKRESDYAFFCRLAAEEGISFWFEDETLFFSDSHLGMTANLPLQYQPQPDTAHGQDVIYQVRLGVRMAPKRSIHRDYNPDRPLSQVYQLESSPEYQAMGTLTPYTIYESYGRFQREAEGKPFVKYRHEVLKNQTQSGSGHSNCIKLMPGKIFEIENHPHTPLNTRWQIVGISHHGRCPQALEDNSGEGTTLSNDFSFIDGYADWRPPFHYKPLADGDESATVVGPEGEEIFVNKDGAIKVHFHWNRYDKADDSASCWVRVAQGWNGNGFGFMAIPRIGQEVIVSYLNGDIDRPIVTGCVYNGLNRPPLDLPAAKTRTTFKTKTHKGEGFNELRFEDAKGSEEVFIHAQKDINAHILNDETYNVGHNQTHHIKNDAHLRVDNEYRVQANNDISLSTGKKLHIKADDALLTQSGNEIHLSSGAKIVIDAGAELTIQAAGHFLKIDAGGITSSAVVNFGSGAPGTGSGWGGKLPDMLDKLKPINVAQAAEAVLASPPEKICISCLMKAALGGFCNGYQGAIMIAVSQEEWQEYQKIHPDMKRYALVDGLQYERLFDEELTYIAGLNNPLFRRYPDAEIAFAGPWLCDITHDTVPMAKFLKLEKTFPAVSWLYTTQSLDALTRHFEPYLNIQLESGETALLRFYDPRILHQLPDIFSQEQLTAFTQPIDEWNYWRDGQFYSMKGAQQ